MKTKSILLSLLMIVSLISCKNAEKEKPVEEVKANTFDVIVDLDIKKDDELILFYKDPSISYFDEKNTVYYGIKGKEESQTVVFSIPEGILPNDIRIDISSKKDQEPIKINSITLSFEGRSFKIDQKDLLKYFTPNEYIKFDEATGIATFINNGEKYDPFFLVKASIYPELEKVRGVKM
ncbi:hypothetical protein [Flavobacterium poyangense]|uniref:hypothetical protein n=1 Tax=Flavobacterium poyangense TaxID=2204302 RepID=UPI0014201313|nr:hypothetical protein [Flavobacterium sp. JXAS1]